MVQQLLQRTASLTRQRATGHLGWLRSAFGAWLGIAAVGLVTMLFLGANSHALPWLVAPLGASAVLVFSVPASPLAQPWSVIGGDLLSAAIGLAVGHWLGHPLISASLAVGLAIAVMSMARCVHPPGGACALLCALGATGGEHWGWIYMLPVTANVLLLVGTGWLYNNLTGHPWPHRPAQLPEPARPHLHYSHEDLEAVMGEWSEVLDVDVDDLDAFYRALERRVAARTATTSR